MVILAKDPSFVILALAGGGCSGVFNTWSASMPNILQGVISDTQNKWLGFATNCAGLGGSISVGRLADSSLFHRRFKALILLLFAVSSVCFLWFACSLPVGWTASTVVIAHAPFWSYMVAGILACFFLGGTVPLSYEIAAEATYPIPGESIVYILQKTHHNQVLHKLTMVSILFYRGFVSGSHHFGQQSGWTHSVVRDASRTTGLDQHLHVFSLLL